MNEVTHEITCPSDASANMKRIVEKNVALYTCDNGFTEIPLVGYNILMDCRGDWIDY